MWMIMSIRGRSSSRLAGCRSVTRFWDFAKFDVDSIQRRLYLRGISDLLVELNSNLTSQGNSSLQYSGNVCDTRFNGSCFASPHRLRHEHQMSISEIEFCPRAMSQFSHLSDRQLAGIEVDTNLPQCLITPLDQMCVFYSMFCFQQIPESSDAAILSVRNRR